MKQGDTIALVAPASGLPAYEISTVAAFIESLGYSAAVYDSCLAEYGYLSGDDALRADDINRAFADPGISGVLAVRGGYGCQRIIDKLDYHLIKKNSKFFGGYSDITALHIALNQIGMRTYHMPMAAKLAQSGGVDGFTLEWALACIEERRFHGISNPGGSVLTSVRPGLGRGVLVGGNLAVMAASLGTAFEIETRNKVLFIEEVDEEPYKIDRALNQLRLAGKLSRASAIVFGCFHNCAASGPSLTITQIIEDLMPRGVPCVTGLECGHCLPTLSLPLGAVVEIDASKGSIYVL